MTRGANIVTCGGVTTGTWASHDDLLVVSWFSEAGTAPVDALRDETLRIATILDKPLQLAVKES